MTKHQLFRLSVLILTASNFLGAQDIEEFSRPTVGYDKGFYVAQGSDYALRVNGRVQTRAQYSYGETKKHEAKISVPNARLMFGGHVFDPRFGYATQLAFDDGNFSLTEFAANLGVLNDDLALKVGYFPGGYTLLEGYSTGKLALISRSFVHAEWSLGKGGGVSLYRSKKKEFGFDLTVQENGVSVISAKRRGAVAASVSYNHGALDASDEMDLEGGPFRILLSAGGMARMQMESYKFIGYAGALETSIKFHNVSLNAGVLAGVPEAAATLSSTPGNVVQNDIKNSIVGLGAYGLLGYAFDRKFGVAARYGTAGTFTKAPTIHEIFGSTSIYIWDHNLKFQLDAGAMLAASKAEPQVRGQLQLAF